VVEDSAIGLRAAKVSRFKPPPSVHPFVLSLKHVARNRHQVAVARIERVHPTPVNPAVVLSFVKHSVCARR
jgi:hypothetical protein